MQAVAGFAYVAFALLAPAVFAARVVRHTEPGVERVVLLTLGTPWMAFVPGGAAFTLLALSTQAGSDPDYAIPLWGVFVMAGAFSALFACQAFVIAATAYFLIWGVSPPTATLLLRHCIGRSTSALEPPP